MAGFAHPAILLALAGLPLLLIAGKSRLQGAARCVVFAGLVTAAAGPRRTREVAVPPGPVVWLLDTSPSMRPGSADAAPADALGFTDPARGIAQAAARAGEGGAVVVATDGRWTAEELASAERERRRCGLPVFLAASPPAEPDAAPAWVAGTAVAREGEPCEILAGIDADPGARGQALLLVDDEPSGRAPWDGTCRVSFRPVLAAGFHRLAIRLEPEVDGDPRNNLALGGVFVTGAAKVLVVEGTREAGVSIAAALDAQGISVIRKPPGEAQGWGDYAAVVLAEVDPVKFAAEAPGLETWVRDGGGLLVVASPPTAAAWQASTLGPLLPLDLRTPDSLPPDAPPATDGGTPAPPEEQPRVLLLLVIDRSGSMEGMKLAAAKEAAIAAAETLGEGDRVGVVAFDSDAHWVIEPSPAVARTGIADAVARMQAGGDTDILAGLEAAADSARSHDRFPVRHILLLTDGRTPPADFRALVTGLAADGVTVSAIGLGEDFDGRLLANIAGWGKGRFYFTATAEEVPRIFTLEARRASGAAPPRPAGAGAVPAPAPPRAEDLLPVLAAEGDPSTDGLGGWPDIAGCCGERVRPGSRLLLRAGARPLLAVTRRGLGPVALFAAPLGGPTAAPWTRWERFPAFSAQLVRTLARPESAGPAVEVRAVGDMRRVSVLSPGARASLDGVPLALDWSSGAGVADLPPGRFPEVRRLDVTTERGRNSRAISWNWPADLAPGPAPGPDWPVWNSAAAGARPGTARRTLEPLTPWALAVSAAGIAALGWLRRRKSTSAAAAATLSS